MAAKINLSRSTRAILQNPPILIFAEATSALDSDLEHAIQQELDRSSRNRTTLIIAHRIVEWGSHKNLLERAGLNAHLWRLQQRDADTMQRESKEV